MFNNVRLSRRLSQITEDALFVEPGGFPKINFFDTAQFAEFFGWPKMFDNVSFFLSDYSRCRSAVFRRFQKIGRVDIMNDTMSEFLNPFSVLQCVYVQLDWQDSNTYRHRLSLE